MELRPRNNFMVRRESSDSDNIGDGEIDEEFRHGEPRAGKQISMKKRKGRPRKVNDAVDRRDPQRTPDSQTKPKRRRRPRPALSMSQVLATLGSYIWETIGRGFTPHVVLVAPGENIVDRISNFKVLERRSFCIISAYGSVSSVVIHKPNTVASTLRFEGMFEILQLAGWFNGVDDKKSITISFSTSDGHVFGGVIVGSQLIAATPVQTTPKEEERILLRFHLLALNYKKPQDPINFTVKYESADSDNMADGEQRSIGDRVIGQEDRLGESTGGKITTMTKRKERPTKNVTVVDQNPSSSADSQTLPNRPPLGHPPGFGKLQVLATLGGYAWETFGGDFTPHIILVAPGENIVNRISNFSVPRSRTVCIISAVGLVSSVIIHDPNSLASTLKFEGMFEILQLSGWSYEGDDIKSMTISFSKLDGNQVFGGVVASSLIAATPVQIIMGSFIQKVWEARMRR